MTTSGIFQGQIHPSAFHTIAGPLATTEATARPHGALRYRCPVNDSLVLVTDDPTLEHMASYPRVRLRCLACGEMHLVTQSPETALDATSGSASSSAVREI